MLPSQTRIEIPLLKELEKAGSKAKPADLYLKVANHFPEITPEDLKVRLPNGNFWWRNRVQFARENLREKGQLDGSVYGIWAITVK